MHELVFCAEDVWGTGSKSIEDNRSVYKGEYHDQHGRRNLF